MEEHLSLDTATLSRNLTATLGYLKRGPEKPAYYVIDPPPGVPRWNGVDDPHICASPTGAATRSGSCGGLSVS
jgi:hypothetical protein